MSTVQPAFSIDIEFTGANKNGVSKSGKPYWVLGAFAHLPGIKHPQMYELFTMDPAALKAPGTYRVPLISSIKEGRLSFEPDLSAAVAAPAPQAGRAA
ncbi:propanediol utilization protein [Xanthomonas campestris]|uniref:propanediol utilization protein n=1 Tax=Xanthomonas campestris TaxID=339 RepID=UPI000E329835|nr:propanediol utilization protein [Xanthomonas campestris]RFF52931.1 propanediol utilization protein [Xanthomonas campestris]